MVAHCDKKKRLAPLLGCLRNLDEAGMSSHVHVQIFESFVNFSFGDICLQFFMFENLVMLWNIWIGNDAHVVKSFVAFACLFVACVVCGLVHVNTCDAMINVNDR